MLRDEDEQRLATLVENEREKVARSAGDRWAGHVLGAASILGTFRVQEDAEVVRSLLEAMMGKPVQLAPNIWCWTARR